MKTVWRCPLTHYSNRLTPAPRVLKVYGGGTSVLKALGWSYVTENLEGGSRILKAYGVIHDNSGAFMTRLCCAIESFEVLLRLFNAFVRRY